MSATRHPPYHIRTRRLVIRCWNPEDAPRLDEAIAESRSDLVPWMPWAADEPRSVDDRVELLRSFRGRFDLGEDFTYGVFDRDERRVVGGTGLHTRVGPAALEIGYWTRTGETGRGIATEVAGALTKVAFERMAVEWVEIRVEPSNAASLAIPPKLGFVREALLRRRHPAADGGRRDLVIFTMFAEEYARSPASKAKIIAHDAAGREIPELAPPLPGRRRR